MLYEVITALEQGLLLCGFCNWLWHMRGLHLTGRQNVDALLGPAADGPPTPGRGWALLASAKDPATPFLRLVDGGVADNLGVISAVDLLLQDQRLNDVKRVGDGDRRVDRVVV